jgi:hypothetical protein
MSQGRRLGKDLGKDLGKVLRAACRVMSIASEPQHAPASNGRPQSWTPRKGRPPSRGARSQRIDSGAAPPDRPRQHTQGLVGALNAEWRRLVQAPGSRRVVASWREHVAALRCLEDLGEVLAAATSPDDRDVLSALLGLARAGDELAARAALQVMLGAAVRLAQRTRVHAGGDLEESIACAVAATWQVVRSYPLERRSCRPADGISLDVLSALTCTGRASLEVASGLPTDLADHPEPEPPEVGELREAFWSLVRPGPRPACGDEQVIMLLAWGVRRGALSSADARLLLRLHSPERPDVVTSCRDLAAELGLAHAAVRQRASRATRRLAAAVHAALSADPAEISEAAVAA